MRRASPGLRHAFSLGLLLSPVVFAPTARAASAVEFVDQFQLPAHGQGYWVQPNSSLSMNVRYKNVGTNTWNNTGGVSNPNFMELRSVNGACTLVNGPMWDGTWINPQRIHGFDGGGSISPGQIATFSFTGKAPAASGDYTLYQWVAPWASSGCQAGWHGVNFWVRVDGEPPVVSQTGGPAPGTYRNDQNIVFNVSDQWSGVKGYNWGWDNPNSLTGTGTSVPLSSVPSQYAAHTLYVKAWDYTVTRSGTQVVQANNTQTYNLGQWTYAPNRAPSIGCPGPVAGQEGSAIGFTVSTSDPDGDPVSVSGQNMPPGSSLNGNSFTWTPAYNQEGDYNPTFTAFDGVLTASCNVAIHVANVDRAPFVTGPSSASVAETGSLSLQFFAQDPDGDGVISFTASGLPAAATFVPSAGNTIGTLSWNPGYADAGTYAVTITAANVLNGSGTCVITVTNVDRGPLVTAPSSLSAEAATTISVSVTASDPDGEPIAALIADFSGLPANHNATFLVDPGNGIGTLRWSPELTDEGAYSVTFTAVNAMSGSAATTLTITPSTRPPSPALLEPSSNAHVTESPSFRWSELADVVAYRLALSEDVGLSNPLWAATISAPDTFMSYVGPPLAPGGAYFWSVQALTANGWSPFGVSRRFYRDSGAPPPPAPSLLSPLDQTQVGLPSNFSWSTIPGAVVYRLRLRDGQAPTPIWMGLTAVPSLTLPSGIIGVGPGSTLSWTVSCIDAAGTEGPESTPWTAGITATPFPPGPVTLVFPAQGSTVNTQTITFSWQASAGASTFDFDYSLAPDFAEGSDRTWHLPGLTRSFVVLRVPPGFATIYWRVTPRNAAGEGPISQTGFFQLDVQRLDVTSVTMLRPVGASRVPVGAPFVASAQILGAWSGPVSGVWRLDGVDGSPFSAAMTSPSGAIVETDALPTSTPGFHTIQCIVTSPAAAASGAAPYEVVDQIPGPAAALSAIVIPTTLEADGLSQATATMSVLDSAGVLVASDNGRVIQQTVAGPATIVSTAGVTTNGQLVSVLQAEAAEGEASITYFTDGLNTVPGASMTAGAEAIEYSGFAFPVANYKGYLLQTFGSTQRHVKNAAGKDMPHTAEDVGYKDAAGKLVICAAGDGVVKYVDKYGYCKGCIEGEPDPSHGGWGWLIVIEHELPANDPYGSKVCTIYGHVHPTGIQVALNQHVKRGQPIAFVGHQECWTDHVHFGVYKQAYGNSDPGYCGQPLPRFSDGVAANGYASALGDYVNPTKFINTHPPTSAEAVVVVPVVNGMLTKRRDEANYLLDQLHDDPELNYDVTPAKAVVANPATSAEALARVSLAAKAIRRIYNSQPPCSKYCDGPLTVSGAKVLADDVSRSIQSILGVGAGSLGAIRRLESGTYRVLFFVKKKASADAIKQAKRKLLGAADKFANAQIRRVRDEGMQRRLNLVKYHMMSDLEHEVEKGTPLADILTGEFFRAGARTALITAGYVGPTQIELNRAACSANRPPGYTLDAATTEVYRQITAAANTSRSAHQIYENDKWVAEQEAQIAKYLDWIAKGTAAIGLAPLSWLASLVHKVPTWLGTAATIEGLVATGREIPTMNARVRDAVNGAFGSAAACPGPTTAREVPLAGMGLAHDLPRALWTRLAVEQDQAATGYEALVRSVAEAVADRDTVRSAELFDQLLTESDVLDRAADLALSPYIASFDDAVLLDADYDSTAFALTSQAASAELTRARLTLSLAAFLESPTDSFVVQDALDAAQAAIFSTSGVKATFQETLPGVLGTPAQPVLRISRVQLPDSMTVDRGYLVTATCTNLGAGLATGNSIILERGYGIEGIAADSLALPDLAPGDTAMVTWIVRPTQDLPVDDYGNGSATLGIRGVTENGIGENRLFPILVGQPDGSVGAPAPNPIPATLQFGIAPNPGHGATAVWFSLPRSAFVRVAMYDVAGRRVATLYRGIAPAGRTAVNWDGRSGDGSKVPNGIYLARIETGEEKLVRKLVWIR